ncbi:hypothetical protein ACWCQV_38220, partial [Streptomyces eurythermus]
GGQLQRAGRVQADITGRIHYCMGAPLARLEIQVVLEVLTRRLPGLRLAVPAADVRWQPGLLLRVPERLPVTW